MESTPEIVFRDVKKTEALDDLINEKISKLEKFADKIISCRVVVEKPQSHQRSGRPYEINITIKIPGRKDIVIKRSAAKGSKNEDLKTLVNAAFDAANRQLKKAGEKMRGDVKTHAEEPRLAMISSLFPDEGYGYLQPPDEGPELYFDRDSLADRNFAELTIGTYVVYEEEIGERGSRAFRIQITERTLT